MFQFFPQGRSIPKVVEYQVSNPISDTYFKWGSLSNLLCPKNWNGPQTKWRPISSFQAPQSVLTLSKVVSLCFYSTLSLLQNWITWHLLWRCWNSCLERLRWWSHGNSCGKRIGWLCSLLGCLVVQHYTPEVSQFAPQNRPVSPKGKEIVFQPSSFRGRVELQGS